MRIINFSIGFCLIGTVIVGLTLMGCTKEFLEKRQNSSINIPATLDDFRMLLDAETYLKQTPSFGEVGSDDYYITTEAWKALVNANERNQYIWKDKIFEVASVPDWNLSYQQVYYANIVLEGLAKMKGIENQEEWKSLKGNALFIRAFAFFNVAQIFSPIYDDNATSNPYGIPIRLTPNIDEGTKRSTIQQTYDQIISDLLEAKLLLPKLSSIQQPNRPSKLAVDGLLARVYLSMRKYTLAKAHADSVLLSYDVLLDFNTLSVTDVLPFPRQNVEVLYQSNLITASSVMTLLRTANGYFVDSNLYKSYHVNDLRKAIYFTGTPRVKGSYSESTRFSGLATDEMWMIRAECQARAGNTIGAMKDLNHLLETRWKVVNGETTFVKYTATDASDALQKILTERRKELVFRGLRWPDLKRLNREGANIYLIRKIDGFNYSLPPNDPRYVLPIPDDVIALSGIEQNPR